VQREDVRRVADHVLCIGSRIATGDKDALANLEVADVGPDGVDVAGSVRSGSVGKVGQARVLPFPAGKRCKLKNDLLLIILS
jgi:hypothetical protein